ncbi:hypothetical protein Cni_G19322 [Canna indica]|uniref:Uncharacterized protein n=1 Tax=Canna indica TaxID=4628 RepID=A0AAQ3KLZ9_9LILI|nr:hypothetical protein Cni_G19322 [Canna indica]
MHKPMKLRYATPATAACTAATGSQATTDASPFSTLLLLRPTGLLRFAMFRHRPYQEAQQIPAHRHSCLRRYSRGGRLVSNVCGRLLVACEQTEEVKSSGEMDHTRESLLLGFGGGIPIGLPRPPPERVSGGGGEGSRLEEEVEMERSSSDKRPWISIRYL